MRAVPLLLFVFMALPAADSPAQTHARQSYEHARQGNLTEAEREIRESIRLEPENSLYHSALGGILQRVGRLDDCAAEYGQAMDSSVSNEPVHAQIASRLEQVYLQIGADSARNGNFTAGLTTATQASRRFPGSAKVLQMLGYFQTKKHMNVVAVGSYQRAVELDPSSAESLVGLGIALSAAGWNAKAVSTLESGITRFPRDPMQYQALGVLLLQTPAPRPVDIERAKSILKAALKLDASLSEPHYQLGNLALQNGQLDEARAHLLAAASAAPFDTRVHFALARLYRRAGDPDRAAHEMQTFERAKAAAASP